MSEGGDREVPDLAKRLVDGEGIDWDAIDAEGVGHAGPGLVRLARLHALERARRVLGAEAPDTLDG